MSGLQSLVESNTLAIVSPASSPTLPAPAAEAEVTTAPSERRADSLVRPSTPVVSTSLTLPTPIPPSVPTTRPEADQEAPRIRAAITQAEFELAAARVAVYTGQHRVAVAQTRVKRALISTGSAIFLMGAAASLFGASLCLNHATRASTVQSATDQLRHATDRTSYALHRSDRSREAIGYAVENAQLLLNEPNPPLIDVMQHLRVAREQLDQIDTAYTTSYNQLSIMQQLLPIMAHYAAGDLLTPINAAYFALFGALAALGGWAICMLSFAAGDIVAVHHRLTGESRHQRHRGEQWAQRQDLVDMLRRPPRDDTIELTEAGREAVANRLADQRIDPIWLTTDSHEPTNEHYRIAGLIMAAIPHPMGARATRSALRLYFVEALAERLYTALMDGELRDEAPAAVGHVTVAIPDAIEPAATEAA